MEGFAGFSVDGVREGWDEVQGVDVGWDQGGGAEADDDDAGALGDGGRGDEGGEAAEVFLTVATEEVPDEN